MKHKYRPGEFVCNPERVVFLETYRNVIDSPTVCFNFMPAPHCIVDLGSEEPFPTYKIRRVVNDQDDLGIAEMYEHEMISVEECATRWNDVYEFLKRKYGPKKEEGISHDEA